MVSALGVLEPAVATANNAISIALMLLFTAAYSVTDGLRGVVATARMLSFAPDWSVLLLPFMTIVALQWVFQASSDGTGYLAQRSMACRSDREACIAGIVFPLTSSEAEGPGFAAARELTFVQGIDELMPSGLRGVLLAVLLWWRSSVSVDGSGEPQGP